MVRKRASECAINTAYVATTRDRMQVEVTYNAEIIQMFCAESTNTFFSVIMENVTQLKHTSLLFS